MIITVSESSDSKLLSTRKYLPWQTLGEAMHKKKDERNVSELCLEYFKLKNQKSKIQDTSCAPSILVVLL